MFTPFRPGRPRIELSNLGDSANIVLTLHAHGSAVHVTHDGFSIGSSRQCDLSLAETSIPALHSVIHMQSGAIWIEAADDDSAILVNDRPYRRMALRHDDRLRIGTSEFTIHLQTESASMIEQAQAIVDEDLSLLTAEELCDRILSEQSMVAEFADGRRSGWEALMRAIESAHEEPVIDEPITNESLDESLKTQADEQIVLDELLEQIQQLNRAIADRSVELSDHEKHVLESTTAMEEAQNQVTHRINEILEQLNQNDPPNELRASA